MTNDEDINDLIARLNALRSDEQVDRFVFTQHKDYCIFTFGNRSYGKAELILEIHHPDIIQSLEGDLDEGSIRNSKSGNGYTISWTRNYVYVRANVTSGDLFNFAHCRDSSFTKCLQKWKSLSPFPK